MDWNHIRAFHATALTGSLSAAARQLGLTQPTLSRQVLALESDLGVSLFERRGRKLMLTQTGSDIFEHIRAMGEAADFVALAASGRVQEIGGRVSISATDSFSAYVLPEIVDRIRAEAPQLTIMVVSANELSNLHRREADVAIRHVRPDRPGLVGQHVGDTEAGFYASANWVAEHGLPANRADLAKAGLIGFDDTARLSGFLREIGIPIEAGDFRLVSDSSVVVWEMVKRGMGVAAMLREVAERTPGVVKLLSDQPPVPVPIWLVTHRELQSSPRIRLVLRILAEAFSKA